jgi:tetratricopeptide (TPR) repeat protein
LANCGRGAFVFDDAAAIVENEALASPWTALTQTGASATTIGRPLLNLSFALDRARGGLDPAPFHLTNLAIHALAGLTLFALLRATLASERVPPRLRSSSGWLAFAAAAIWTVHPLQTESVTYVCQRAESLAGLLSLGALLASVRGAGSRAWSAISVLLCLLAATTKETAVVVPALALLHDRTFGAGSFREALRRRPLHYAGLAASWVVVAALYASTDGRRGSAGFGAGVGAAEYAATQPGALLEYLRLAVWPDALVLDRGASLARTAQDAAPAAVAIALLASATVWALSRRPLLAFAPAWFFLCLAPTSSFVPLATQTSAEHRTYLALAGVVAPAVLLAHALLARIAAPAGRRAASAGLLALVLGALAARTSARNDDYADPEVLWTQSAAFDPSNVRPHLNLGLLRARRGDLGGGIAHLDAAVAADPANTYVRLVRGNLLHAAGRHDEAVEDYTVAAASAERAPRALTSRALVRRAQGRASLARAEIDAVLARWPDYEPARRARAALAE